MVKARVWFRQPKLRSVASSVRAAQGPCFDNTVRTLWPKSAGPSTNVAPRSPDFARSVCVWQVSILIPPKSVQIGRTKAKSDNFAHIGRIRVTCGLRRPKFKRHSKSCCRCNAWATAGLAKSPRGRTATVELGASGGRAPYGQRACRSLERRSRGCPAELGHTFSRPTKSASTPWSGPTQGKTWPRFRGAGAVVASRACLAIKPHHARAVSCCTMRR